MLLCVSSTWNSLLFLISHPPVFSRLSSEVIPSRVAFLESLCCYPVCTPLWNSLHRILIVCFSSSFLAGLWWALWGQNPNDSTAPLSCHSAVDWRKNAQHKSCEFGFYLGTLLRTLASQELWENRSEEAGEKPVYIYMIFGCGIRAGKHTSR